MNALIYGEQWSFNGDFFTHVSYKVQKDRDIWAMMIVNVNIDVFVNSLSNFGISAIIHHHHYYYFYTNTSSAIDLGQCF